MGTHSSASVWSRRRFSWKGWKSKAEVSLHPRWVVFNFSCQLSLSFAVNVSVAISQCWLCWMNALIAISSSLYFWKDPRVAQCWSFRTTDSSFERSPQHNWVEPRQVGGNTVKVRKLWGSCEKATQKQSRKLRASYKSESYKKSCKVTTIQQVRRWNNSLNFGLG